MASDYKLIDHSYDVVIVGAGGAGLRATLGMAAAGLSTACITNGKIQILDNFCGLASGFGDRLTSKLL